MTDPDLLRPPPAYQEYASDLLADRNYRSMNLAERGLFHTLRLELWQERTLPADLNKLADLLRFPGVELENAFTWRVGAFFEITEHAITCPELDRQRAKLEQKRRKQSEGGALGGQRAQERLRENQANPQGDPEGYPKVTNRKELSRKRVSRDEWDRGDLKKDDLSDAQRKWIDDYDQNNDQQ